MYFFQHNLVLLWCYRVVLNFKTGLFQKLFLHKFLTFSHNSSFSSRLPHSKKFLTNKKKFLTSWGISSRLRNTGLTGITLLFILFHPRPVSNVMIVLFTFNRLSVKFLISWVTSNHRCIITRYFFLDYPLCCVKLFIFL